MSLLSFMRPKITMQVGLVMHPTRLSLVRLKQVKQTYTLEACASIAIPSHRVVEETGNHFEQIAQAMKQLVTLTHSELCYACLGIPAASVIHKQVNMIAGLSDAERMTEITENMMHYLPGIQESLYVDYAYLESNKQEDKLMLVAARSERVNQYVAAAEQAGLRIRVLDVDIYALARVLGAEQSAQRSVIILDVDSSVAQFILLERGEIRSTHQMVFHTDETVIQQLKHGLQLFCTRAQLPTVEKIMLTGPRDYLESIRYCLQEELGIWAEISTALQHVPLAPQLERENFYYDQAAFITAFGLAKRSFPTW